MASSQAPKSKSDFTLLFNLERAEPSLSSESVLTEAESAYELDLSLAGTHLSRLRQE
jgi:hypothetical protein